MRYLIKYIKDMDFVGTESFTGSLDEATTVAAAGMKKYNAETAAVMAEDDSDGRPKALLNA